MDTATTEIYTLSLHDALPIWFRYLKFEIEKKGKRKKKIFGHPGPSLLGPFPLLSGQPAHIHARVSPPYGPHYPRSEEHTSELQSRRDLVCRLLLEKKKKNMQLLNTPLKRSQSEIIPYYVYLHHTKQLHAITYFTRTPRYR